MSAGVSTGGSAGFMGLATEPFQENGSADLDNHDEELEERRGGLRFHGIGCRDSEDIGDGLGAELHGSGGEDVPGDDGDIEDRK